MLPYLLVFLFSLINLIIYDTLKRENQYGQQFFLFLSFFSLILLSSLRDPSVGTDTYTYLLIWGNSPSELSDLIEQSTLFNEPAFYLLSYLTKYISVEFFNGSNIPFFMCIAFIVLVLSYSSIIQYSQFIVFSLFLFLMLGFYTFHFNGVRQSITIAIFIYSIRFIINGNFQRYLVCILIGFLIHKSMLICLPFYYFFRQPLTVRIVALTVFSSCLIAFSIQTLVEYASAIDQRYSTYANSDYGGGGLITTLFNNAMFFWLFFVKRANKIESKLYDISILSMLIASCLGIISVILSLNPSGILRLTVYFSQFLIFALPISIYSFKYRLERILVMLLSIFFMFAYFYITTKNFSGLTPYKFSLDSLF